MWDVFVCHASEDKEPVARPLAHRLESFGVRVWLDERALRVGDSLRHGIDDGLAHSQFGVVILSPAFFGKNWTQAELGALFSKESSDRRVVLPVWYKITVEEVRRHSPLLADRVAARWDEGEDAVVAKLLEVLRPSQASVATLDDLATLDSLQSKLTVVAPAGRSYNSFAWAAGHVDDWWYPGPGAYWPPGVERVETVGAFTRAFESIGYRVCTNGDFDAGYEKVVLHGNDSGSATHAARQLTDGRWSSKLGSLETVVYDDASTLVPLYGKIILYMKRVISRQGPA